MVELLAVVLWLTTCGLELEGEKLVLLVDSEAAIGALVKGCSSEQDVGILVA